MNWICLIQNDINIYNCTHYTPHQPTKSTYPTYIQKAFDLCANAMDVWIFFYLPSLANVTSCLSSAITSCPSSCIFHQLRPFLAFSHGFSSCLCVSRMCARCMHTWNEDILDGNIVSNMWIIEQSSYTLNRYRTWRKGEREREREREGGRDRERMSDGKV